MRRRNKNKLTKRNPGRVTAVNARANGFRHENPNALHGLIKLVTPARYRDFINVQDYRRFNPDPYEVPFNTSGRPAPARFVPAVSNRRARRDSSNNVVSLSSRVVFNRPHTTLECIRRQRRKEVIHARRIAGTRVAPPRFTDLSKLHCK